MPPPPVIEIRDLRHGVDGHEILHGVSWRSGARRIGVVGRNGSGKTTLARALCGLVETRGTVSIDGIVPGQDRVATLRAVGLLFQNPDRQIIFPTVGEELAFGLGQMGHDRAARADIVARTLARFGRPDWAERAVNDLSQGQRQLVCLMAILAMAPQVIVLDEPFSGLDIPTRMRLARILADVEATLVHITHDPRDLDGYDEVLWLEGGRVAGAGPAEAVLRDYRAAMEEIAARDDDGPRRC